MRSIRHKPLSRSPKAAGEATTELQLGRVLVAASLVALLALWGCSRATTGNAGRGNTQEPAPVTVAVAMKTNVPVLVHAIDHVVAFSSVAVQSRVDGVLERVHFQQGETVRQGSLIFSIDPRPFQAALDQAKATLQKDKALARYAEIDARRNAELFRQGIIPQDTNDQSRANADAAEATVAADEAAVENARLQLSFCSIKSPITGRAGTLNVNAGNVVKNLTTVLVTLNQTEPIYVDFSVPERDLPRIRDYLAATGELEVVAIVTGHERNPSPGALTIINNTVDTNTGTILLRATFPNRDELLWPGQFVNTALTLTTLTNAVVVPQQSVQIGQQGHYVFVVGPNSTVETRAVAVGNQVGPDIVIRKGVGAGERVVTQGQVRLAPGTKVRIESPHDTTPGEPQ